MPKIPKTKKSGALKKAGAEGLRRKMEEAKRLKKPLIGARHPDGHFYMLPPAVIKRALRHPEVLQVVKRISKAVIKGDGQNTFDAVINAEVKLLCKYMVLKAGHSRRRTIIAEDFAYALTMIEKNHRPKYFTTLEFAKDVRTSAPIKKKKGAKKPAEPKDGKDAKKAVEPEDGKDAKKADEDEDVDMKSEDDKAADGDADADAEFEAEAEGDDAEAEAEDAAAAAADDQESEAADGVEEEPEKLDDDTEMQDASSSSSSSAAADSEAKKPEPKRKRKTADEKAREDAAAFVGQSASSESAGGSSRGSKRGSRKGSDKGSSSAEPATQPASDDQ